MSKISSNKSFHYLRILVLNILLSVSSFSVAMSAEVGHVSRGHSDDTHDNDEGHSSGHRGKGYRGGRQGSNRHDVARGGGKAVENKIFQSNSRPVWAQEGLPEVELGRLNVARAPSSVLIRAENEALANYVEEMSELYNLDAYQASALLKTNFSNVSRYDSPLQNLALYKDIMTFGVTELRTLDGTLSATSQLDLAAIFLGSASDKTIPISENSIIAINRILGLVEMNSDELNTLAIKAELVREAILIGHGPVDDH